MATEFTTTLDPKALLIAQYNALMDDPNQKLNEYDYVFGAPVSASAPGGKNTKLKVYALAARGKYGIKTLHYDRIDLGAVVVQYPYPLPTGLSVEQALAQLNAYYGFFLQLSDLSVTLAEGGSILTLLPDSLMFMGEFTLLLVNHMPGFKLEDGGAWVTLETGGYLLLE